MKHTFTTPIIDTIAEIRNRIRELKNKNLIIGFVPTMGALHAGHESLIEKARQECGAVIVSIFVNPTQFGPNEDFGKYPRQLEADREICSRHGVDLIFAPEPEQMYPQAAGPITTVVPPETFRNRLCGETRKGHFNGVATVVLKLFNIITPDRAYFGKKDAQQLLIIKKMVKDLDIPVEIAGCETVREPGGLACSSRNKYLTEEAGKKAASIYEALKTLEKQYNSGLDLASELISVSGRILHPDIEVEYFEAIDIENFQAVKKVQKGTLIAIAVKLGGVRLIDNIIID